MTHKRWIIAIAVFIVCVLGVFAVRHLIKPSPQERFNSAITSVSTVYLSDSELSELLFEYCQMEPLEQAVQYGDLYDMVGADKADEIINSARDYCEDMI